MTRNGLPAIQTSHYRPYGLLVLDGDFKVISVDERFRQLFHCSEHALLGVPLDSLFNERDRKGVIDFHRKISGYQSGFIEQAIELQYADCHGYVFMRLVNVKEYWLGFFENLQGPDAGLIGELFSSHDRYCSVIRNADDGIVLLDDSNRLIEFNRSFFDMLSLHNERGILFNESALLGRDFFELVGTAFSAISPVIEAARHTKRAQLKHPVEFQNFSLLLDITPIFQPALGYIGCSIVIHDRTAQIRLEKRAQELASNEIRLVREKEAERRELEAQLRQAQKMEAIGQLTGGIAHDFNNILTSVLGNAELSLEMAGTLNAPKLQRYLLNLIQSAERARDLIAQMLVFSRGQRGIFRVQSLHQVIEDTVKLLGLSLPSSIRLEIDRDEQAGPVKHDALQIEQVLMNLCLNAHEAMDGAGKLTISLQNRIGLDQVCNACIHHFCGDFVELTVSDAGCGMDSNTLERMFEPFFTTKEIGKGSGMGLAMVHGIVHEHEGHILVESEQGSGTTFRLLFPLMRTAHISSPARPARPASLDSKRPLSASILLVDDEEQVAVFMCDFLRSRGLNVTQAASGSKAVQLFRERPDQYDLVITDQTMPETSGLELAGVLLGVRPDVPIILYTGYSEILTEQQVLHRGIRALLKKPVNTRILMRTVNRLLNEPGNGGR